jgi:hypothetical protein
VINTFIYRMIQGSSEILKEVVGEIIWSKNINEVQICLLGCAAV